MKILQTSFYNPFLNEGGGIEQVIYQFAKNLNKIGHKVDIICMGDQDKVIKTKFGKLFVFKVPRFKMFGKFSIFLRKAIYNEKLKMFIKENGINYDILHVHGDIGGFKELARFNTILTLHGFAIQTHKDRNLLDKLFIRATSGRTEINNMKYSKKIVAVSNNVKYYASKYTRKKIEVLYNGVDTNVYAPLSHSEKIRLRHKLGFNDSTIYLLFVGGEAYRKGLDIAIDAVRLLSMKNVYLNIIGIGKQNKHISNSIRFMGRVSELEKIKCYQASDIFVLPSRGEGFALAPLEAISCGLPIIVSKFTGINEISKNKEAIVIGNLNSGRYAKEIAKIIKNKSYTKKYRKKARWLALKYDWEAITKKYELLYRNV